MSESFRVWFVCTGNRARSPLAAALFRRRTDGLPVSVASAGTLDVVAKPALPEAVAVAEARGIDLLGHRSASLASNSLSDADLVVGFEPAHLEAAISEGGAAAERTFMLLELPQLLNGLAPPPAAGEVEHAREVVAEMDRRRSASPSGFIHSLADPFGESRQVFAETARVIDAMTGLLASKLFP